MTQAARSANRASKLWLMWHEANRRGNHRRAAHYNRLMRAASEREIENFIRARPNVAAWHAGEPPMNVRHMIIGSQGFNFVPWSPGEYDNSTGRQRVRNAYRVADRFKQLVNKSVLPPEAQKLRERHLKKQLNEHKRRVLNREKARVRNMTASLGHLKIKGPNGQMMLIPTDLLHAIAKH